MISHTYKCIFVHIPKTAGTSIEKKLGLFDQLKEGVQDHRTIREVEPFPLTRVLQPEHWPTVPGRIKGVLKRQRRITPENYHNYYKFAFVRNSWSRTYSWYKNVMRGKIHQDALNISPDCSFKDFIKYHLDNNWAMKSQLQWITDARGEIPLDFIGRFEQLDKDFTRICNDIGIEDNQLPQLLKAQNAHYTDFFDDEMKDIIAQRFKDEIKYFKFEFGE